MWEVTAYPVEALGAILSPLGLIVLVIGFAIASVIPAFVNQAVMYLVFRESVAFRPIFMVFVGVGLISVIAFLLLSWIIPFLKTGDPDVLYLAEGVVPNLLSTAALVLVQSFVLSFVAPNRQGLLLATWVWVVVAVLSWAAMIALIVMFGFLIALNMSPEWGDVQG